MKRLTAGPTYWCSACGNVDVELCFPCWIPANRLDEDWTPDWGAAPEDEESKCWCNTCEDHCFLERNAADLH